MAIPANSAQIVVEGEEVALSSTTGIADGGFSTASNSTISVIDNSTDGYTGMDVFVDATMTATPVDGDAIGIYLRRVEIFGAVGVDENVPSANNRHGFIGLVGLDSSGISQRLVLGDVSIPKGKFELYVEAIGEGISTITVKVQRTGIGQS